MDLIVSEVYDALIEAGSSPEKARAAAAAVPAAENMATKEDIGDLKQDIARLESRMATKEDVKQEIARLDKDIAKLDKRIAVLNLAVFSFGPAIVAMLVKLTLFP